MNYCHLGLSVIEVELQAIQALTQRIDHHFETACHLLLNCKGRVVVSGMGKSGHIANKIAATFASTGTPAFFMHPAEAIHGDWGMITSQDVLVVISNSGTTPELVTLIPLLKRLQVPLIALTGNPGSTLAQSADAHLNVGVEKEACPLGLAPTASTTAALVMGDALAIALLQTRGFTVEDFARSHPGGALGRQLLLRINTLWHTGTAMPLVNEQATMSEALIEVTEKKLGMTCVVNTQGILTGIFTDGDIRRALTHQYDVNTTPVQQIMSAHARTIAADALAAEALATMQEHKITVLVVVDETNRPSAIIHLHDLLKAGVI